VAFFCPLAREPSPVDPLTEVGPRVAASCTRPGHGRQRRRVEPMPISNAVATSIPRSWGSDGLGQRRADAFLPIVGTGWLWPAFGRAPRTCSCGSSCRNNRRHHDRGAGPHGCIAPSSSSSCSRCRVADRAWKRNLQPFSTGVADLRDGPAGPSERSGCRFVRVRAH